MERPKMRIVEAITKLEQSLIRYGDVSERELVLDGKRNESLHWPADGPAAHPDARTWLAWRELSMLSPMLRMPGKLRYAELVKVGGGYWNECMELIVQLGRPTLIPVLGELFCDGIDGSIWAATRDDNGWSGFEQFDKNLATVLAGIAIHYAELSRAPWRRQRIGLPVEGVVFRPTDRYNEAELEHVCSGTTFISTFTTSRRFAVNGSVWVKLGDNQWVTTTTRNWKRGETSDDDVRSLLSLLRLSLDHYQSDTHAAERRLHAEANKPGGAVDVGVFRVWKQPTFETILAGLDSALEQFPNIYESLREGASDAELDATEDVLGYALPPEVRALYGWSDGQAEDLCGPTFYWRYRLCSLQQSLANARSLRALRAQFGAEYWPNSALPFLQRGNSDCIYVDLGGDVGPVGCVVDFNHEQPAIRKVLYGSVTEWLECFVDGLEDDLFVMWENGLFPRDFADQGDFAGAEAHDEERTNGRYPWTRRLTLSDGR
jgi:cell wall assembly regulator SMI1